ncbi:toll-like receptor Tollo [Mercenaria mercenaria]|uniref:toll-like receptor Tollo n=1 Tax=Mercenaria mercenaria TaxID=6596 RepID=UPI00234E8974|nr:toll-like receptor Tollo [Mercenaria mercenaria]
MIIQAAVGHGKELRITWAQPPEWHLKFSDRLMPSRSTLDYVRRHNPSEIDSISLKISDKIPWDKLPRKTVLLVLECTEGYDNPEFISEINQGFVGRYLKLTKYLKISDCFIQELKSETFRRLERLTTLEITSKDLLHLHPDVFQPLKSLIWINFQDCNIESISSELFCANPKLAFVSFRNNNIRDIFGVRSTQNVTCNAGTLNSFSLDGNNIGDLTNVNFESFKLNGILTLANSSIRALSRKPFDGLSDVLTIDLKRNFIRHIPDYAFSSLNTTLQYMNFGYNRLQTIDVSKTFSGLKLETLHLENNNITSLTGRLSDLRFLEELYLQNNALRKVSYETFGNLAFLDTLNLTHNNIEVVEAGVFDISTNLRKIYIAGNKIKDLPDGIFDGASRLTHLYINSNNIESLDENIFAKCKNLEWIEIQNNKLSNVSRLVFASTKINFIKIEHNKFTSVPVFTRPGLSTDCFNFSRLHQIKARYNAMSFFDTTCHKALQNLDLSYNLLSDISNFGALQNIVKLFLRNNRIKTLPTEAMKGLCTNLEMLDVGKNLIETIDKGTFSNCLKLETLKLDVNSLKVFEPLYQASFRDLRLAWNPLTCDCTNMRLINWLNTSSTVHIDHFKCENGAELKSFRLDNCTAVYVFNWKPLVLKIVIPASSILLLAGIIAIVIFKFRYEFQVIAFYRWNIRFRCFCMNKAEDYVERKYDAFICFAEEDVSFVKTRLIPILEPKYNICIYYRDFPVGEDIAESILDTIDRSGVIILLLSEHFMNSRWGTFEFRSAHYAAIRKKNKRLLIVVMNESFLKMKMDLTLRSVLYTKSYLRADDRLFKEKMIHSMPDEPVTNKAEIDLNIGENPVVSYGATNTTYMNCNANHVNIVADYIANNVNIVVDYISNHVNIVVDYIDNHVNIVADYIANHVNCAAYYIANHVIIVADYIAIHVNCAAYYIANHVNVVADYIVNHTNYDTDYIASHVNNLADYIVNHIDVVADYITKPVM